MLEEIFIAFYSTKGDLKKEEGRIYTETTWEIRKKKKRGNNLCRGYSIA